MPNTLKKLLTLIPLLIAVASCAVALSLWKSYYTNQWHWFGRSGAIITLMGAILATRRMIRLGVVEYHRDSKTISGGTFGESDKDRKQELANAEDLRDTKASYYGFWFVVIGTVIWAYGDLFGTLFEACKFGNSG